MKRDARGQYTPRYRSRLEIISLVLGVVSKGPVTKTRLMYGAYLSHEQLIEYLEDLLSRGLIAAKPSGGRQPLYSLTEKGLKVLRASETVAKLLQPASHKFDGDYLGGNVRRQSLEPIPRQTHRLMSSDKEIPQEEEDEGVLAQT